MCLSSVVNSAPQIQLSGSRQVLRTFFHEIASELLLYHLVLLWLMVIQGRRLQVVAFRAVPLSVLFCGYVLPHLFGRMK